MGKQSTQNQAKAAIEGSLTSLSYIQATYGTMGSNGKLMGAPLGAPGPLLVLVGTERAPSCHIVAFAQ